MSTFGSTSIFWNFLSEDIAKHIGTIPQHLSPSKLLCPYRNNKFDLHIAQRLISIHGLQLSMNDARMFLMNMSFGFIPDSNKDNDDSRRILNSRIEERIQLWFAKSKNPSYSFSLQELFALAIWLYWSPVDGPRLFRNLNLTEDALDTFVGILGARDVDSELLPVAVTCLSYLVESSHKNVDLLTNSNILQLMKLCLKRAIYTYPQQAAVDKEKPTSDYFSSMCRCGILKLLEIPKVCAADATRSALSEFVDKWWSRLTLVADLKDGEKHSQEQCLYALEVIADICERMPLICSRMIATSCVSSKKLNISFLNKYIQSLDPRTSVASCNLLTILLSNSDAWFEAKFDDESDAMVSLSNVFENIVTVMENLVEGYMTMQASTESWYKQEIETVDTETIDMPFSPDKKRRAPLRDVTNTPVSLPINRKSCQAWNDKKETETSLLQIDVTHKNFSYHIICEAMFHSLSMAASAIASFDLRLLPSDPGADSTDVNITESEFNKQSNVIDSMLLSSEIAEKTTKCLIFVIKILIDTKSALSEHYQIGSKEIDLERVQGEHCLIASANVDSTVCHCFRILSCMWKHYSSAPAFSKDKIGHLWSINNELRSILTDIPLEEKVLVMKTFEAMFERYSNDGLDDTLPPQQEKHMSMSLDDSQDCNLDFQGCDGDTPFGYQCNAIIHYSPENSANNHLNDSKSSPQSKSSSHEDSNCTCTDVHCDDENSDGSIDLCADINASKFCDAKKILSNADNINEENDDDDENNGYLTFRGGALHMNTECSISLANDDRKRSCNVRSEINAYQETKIMSIKRASRGQTARFTPENGDNIENDQVNISKTVQNDLAISSNINLSNIMGCLPLQTTHTRNQERKAHRSSATISCTNIYDGNSAPVTVVENTCSVTVLRQLNCVQEEEIRRLKRELDISRKKQEDADANYRLVSQKLVESTAQVHELQATLKHCHELLATSAREVQESRTQILQSETKLHEIEAVRQSQDALLQEAWLKLSVFTKEQISYKSQTATATSRAEAAEEELRLLKMGELQRDAAMKGHSANAEYFKTQWEDLTREIQKLNEDIENIHIERREQLSRIASMESQLLICNQQLNNDEQKIRDQTAELSTIQQLLSEKELQMHNLEQRIQGTVQAMEEMHVAEMAMKSELDCAQKQNNLLNGELQKHRDLILFINKVSSESEAVTATEKDRGRRLSLDVGLGLPSLSL